MKSDSELLSEMRDEVTRQRGGRTDDIDIQVFHGVVTLTGDVQSDLERWNLRDAITGMPGVERLIDETMVVPEPSVRSTDADIARPWFPAD
jgi:osmotically-inducible protein OsmY